MVTGTAQACRPAPKVSALASAALCSRCAASRLTPLPSDFNRTAEPSTSAANTLSSASPSSVFTAPTTGQTNIAAIGPYKLVRSYEGESFFDGWDFFTEDDPTEASQSLWCSILRARLIEQALTPLIVQGQVEYVTRAVAEANGLISSDGGSAIMRVDNKSQLGKGERRKSVRIESSEPAEIGSLVLADITRMPWGCSGASVPRVEEVYGDLTLRPQSGPHGGATANPDGPRGARL